MQGAATKAIRASLADDGSLVQAPRLEAAGAGSSLSRKLTQAFDTGLTRADLHPERPMPIETPWGSMTMFVVAERVLATQSFCSHLEGPLFQGTLSGETITCPWHQWRFSLVDGKRLDASSILRSDSATLLVCDVRPGPLGTLVLSNPHRGSVPIRES